MLITRLTSLRYDKKNDNEMPCWIMLSLCKTLVIPHVDTTKKDEFIEKIQHRFTKMIKIWRANSTKTD